MEMCEPSCIKYTGGSSFTCSDKATARAVAKRTYESAVELFAMLCKQYNLNPTADGVIISHREGHSRGIASNHGDPEHLWNGLGMGYTMDGFRKAVKAKMNGSSNTDHSGTSGLQASALKNLSEADVIAKVGPLFTADQKASGILASVSLAQFILESGYGKSELAQNANNCFGMKKSLSGNTWGGSAWDGTSIYTKKTQEYENGAYVTVTADFRKYPSVEKFIADHSDYLLGAKNGSRLRYDGLKADTDDRTEEADKVAVRIAKILSEKAFSFTPNEYISIHKKLFAGIYGHAGKLRDYNITKKEWVLNGATVLYGSASELRATLDYDFAEEKKFSYKNLSMEEIIHHLAFFVSRLWQIHVFGEGNTRTTAVFFIKYLRTLGFDATNDIFAENAWYFRNALVRANYNDLKNGVHETTEYLELFLRNLLLDEKNELHNRTMHISGRFAEVDIERVKVDIKSREVDIESTKVDIRNKLLSFSDTISEKTINHTVEIFSKCGKENCFGRTIVEEITGLKPSRASKLIKLLVDSEVIVPVTGHGKGKYRFQ